jgi:hypothetical protein
MAGGLSMDDGRWPVGFRWAVAGGLPLELRMPHPHVVVERTAAGYLRLLISRPDRRNALITGPAR